MAVKLSQQDVVDLKKQGYSDQEIGKAVGEIERDELREVHQVQGINPDHKPLHLAQAGWMTLQDTNWS